MSRNRATGERAVETLTTEAGLDLYHGTSTHDSPPSRSVVEFRQVSKSYIRNASRTLLRRRLLNLFRRSRADWFHALDKVSFELNAGESLAVVGPNGAGKSTLLRLCAGISFPDQGAVSVNGTVAALLELGSGFHPDLTGAENVLLNASLLGLSRRKALEQFDSIVEFSGISEFIDEPLRTYSSGMVLRLAFSVAVRVDPAILIIDELLAVGDQNFQKKCIDEILRLKAMGKTLICVSHAPNTLRDLCERAIWLERGRIVKSGATDEVLRSYASGVGA